MRDEKGKHGVWDLHTSNLKSFFTKGWHQKESGVPLLCLHIRTKGFSSKKGEEFGGVEERRNHHAWNWSVFQIYSLQWPHYHFCPAHSTPFLNWEVRKAFMRGLLGPKNQSPGTFLLSFPDTLPNYKHSQVRWCLTFPSVIQGQQHLLTSQSYANCKVFCYVQGAKCTLNLWHTESFT